MEFIMIKNCKLEARILLLKNYRLFLFPSILLMCLNAISHMILIEYVNSILYFSTARLLHYILLFLFFIIELVFIPIAIVRLFQASANVVQGVENSVSISRKKTKFRNIIKIFLINLVPRASIVIYNIGDSMNTYIYDSDVFNVILFALSILIWILEYKFFACNYHFVTNKDTVSNTLHSSFSTMKKRFRNYFILSLSFLVWELLAVGIYIALLLLTGNFKGEYTYLSVLLTFGCGIYFYVLPYKYLTYYIFCDKLAEDISF